MAPVRSSGPSSTAASRSASPTREPRRCTSSPPSTPCRRCGPSSVSSKGSSPARPTATVRMKGRPAAALFHLGPGFGNAIANLHNARRAHTPIVAVVGDHATYHKRLDAPLESDIDALAGTVSGWVRRSWRPGDVGADAADAVAAARTAPGQTATLVLPADVSWGPGGRVASPRPVGPGRPVDDRSLAGVAARWSRGRRPSCSSAVRPLRTTADWRLRAPLPPAPGRGSFARRFRPGCGGAPGCHA